MARLCDGKNERRKSGKVEGEKTRMTKNDRVESLAGSVMAKRTWQGEKTKDPNVSLNHKRKNEEEKK